MAILLPVCYLNSKFIPDEDARGQVGEDISHPRGDSVIQGTKKINQLLIRYWSECGQSQRRLLTNGSDMNAIFSSFGQESR